MSSYSYIYISLYSYSIMFFNSSLLLKGFFGGYSASVIKKQHG